MTNVLYDTNKIKRAHEFIVINGDQFKCTNIKVLRFDIKISSVML